MRIALLHDWLTGMRGGEKVLQEIASLYPEADLFTLIHRRGSCPTITAGRDVHTSWLDHLPGVRKYYRYLLPAMPHAIESLDLSDYDLILSTSHCVAKGARKRDDATHICYCHSPMRYIWEQADSYQATMTGLGSLGLGLLRSNLRRWDVRTASRVDRFVANSHNVADRIARFYHRSSRVIYPPVNTEFFSYDEDIEREDYYLVVSAMAPYKRVDHAVEAFRKLPHERLVVIGSGQQEKMLRTIASKNTTFVGWGDDDMIRYHYRRCRALLFPGEEDFGIVPVEAMACGAPVIAYGAGGALETVRDISDPTQTRPTGLFYPQQTVEHLLEALKQFESVRHQMDPLDAANAASAFSRETFRREYQAMVDRIIGHAST